MLPNASSIYARMRPSYILYTSDPFLGAKLDNLAKEFAMTEPMNARKDDRFKIAPLSEYYEDLLRADAFLARNTLPGQAKSDLQAYLAQKEVKIKEKITYLAEKRNISYKEMWNQIQSGTVQEVSKQELADLPDDENDSD